MSRKSENVLQKKKYPPLTVSRSSINSKQCVDNDDLLPLLKWVKKEKMNDSSHFDGCDQEQPPPKSARNEHLVLRKLNAKVSYEIMAGYRYNSKVLFCPEEQQFYLSNSATDSCLKYTCYVKECRCRVEIRDEQCYIANTMPHEHEKKTDMYRNLCALNEVKSALRSADIQSSTRQVFDDVIKR